MRIEVAPPKLRVSGDIYVSTPVTGGGPIVILKPITETRCCSARTGIRSFRSNSIAGTFGRSASLYQNGKLTFRFERNMWNRTTQEFTAQDNGFMQLDCRAGNLFTHPLLPQPTLRLTGVAQIGWRGV